MPAEFKYAIERAAADQLPFRGTCRAKHCLNPFEFYCLFLNSYASSGDQVVRKKRCREHAEAYAKKFGVTMPA